MKKLTLTLGQKSALLSLALFGIFLLVWQLATLPATQTEARRNKRGGRAR